MRVTLPGIGGGLFPSRYLADQLLRDVAVGVAPVTDTARRAALRRQLVLWWQHVIGHCGPASGVRSLFDVAAMPLAAALGFRATSVAFTARSARVSLEPRGAQRLATAPTAMLVTTWARRSPEIWRDAVVHARAIGAPWCLIVAPPYLQILDASTWSRRATDFTFPEVLEDEDSFERFATLAEAGAFTAADGALSRIAQCAAAAERFQDGVRRDLQRGVADSLDTLAAVVTPARANRPSDEPLAIIYRVLFLLFAESRDLVPWRHPLYQPAYSISTMCDAALQRPAAAGFWPGLAAISRLLRVGCRTPELDVPPFNGHLFSRDAAPSLERRTRSARGPRAASEDRAIAETLINLSTRATRYGREAIAYPDLGVEQLGAVYERVLGHPHRKQSGTFYTPRALTEFVARRTLAPLTRSASADAILNLRIVDPAMGSGAFLVAACRFLATEYERALIAERRIAEHEVDADARANFRRTIAQRCLYGVDRNPVAVQLARLSLWLATLASGKPLSFLDHRLRTGDALIGARPDDLRHASTRREHRALPLLDDALAERDAAHLSSALISLASEADDGIEQVRRKEALWARINAGGSVLSRWRLASHAWCTPWFASTHSPSASDARTTRAAIDALLRGDRTLPTGTLAQHLAQASAHAERHRFFHWPLEFADAFFDHSGQTRADAGFDAVIGNPPWEMLRADHGDAGTPAALVRFIRESGQYAACGRGHVNLYQPFVERALDLTRHGGSVGLVLPWGLASDDGAADLRARLLDRCRTTTLVGLDNAQAIFPVHRGVRFLALVTSPGGRTDELPMIGGVKTSSQIEQLLDDASSLRGPLRLSRGLLAASGGEQRRLPDVRSATDAALLDALTSRWPALGALDSWGVTFGRELNVTEDRQSFGDHGLPVIEGKHVQPFGVDISAPRFRITAAAAARALPGHSHTRARLAYRDVSAVSNRQSLIAAVVPHHVVTTHTLFCMKTPLDLERQYFLCACFNSYVLNAIVRMLMGGHLTTSLVESLPVPPWTGSRRQGRVARLSGLLSANGPSAGGAARLQGLVAAEYGIDADQFARILSGFPLVPPAERELARAALLDILMKG